MLTTWQQIKTFSNAIMAAQEEFEKTMREKYGGLKTVKAFQDLVFKAYDDNLDGLLSY